MMNNMTLHVYNPSTGDLISSLDTDSQETASEKIHRAQTLFQSQQRRLPRYERIVLLEKLIDYITQHKHTFIDTMVQEGGKPLKDSIIEFNRAVQGIKIAIQSINQQAGANIPLGYQASSADRIATTQHFPIGVVLAFSAFNHPLNLIVHQVIPAFASGCPCIIKPSPDTPLSCIKLVAAMHHVGIPEDYIQTIITQDNTLASTLVESDKISFFSFIGSAKVGWQLRSKLKPGVRCALEHGGIAPCIVSNTAIIKNAVNAIAKGGFYHAGQVCVSTQKVIIHHDLFSQFTDRLTEKTAQLSVGDAASERSDIGPLIRSSEVDRVDTWVKEAMNKGAVCQFGGKRISNNYYQPTILVKPSATARIANEEVFGPVLCLYSYKTLEQAFELSRHPNFSFQAAIFSEDVNEITAAYNNLSASAVIVNDHTAFRDDIMPFAGLNHSGLGVGGIPYTISEMQYKKMLVLKKQINTKAF